MAGEDVTTEGCYTVAYPLAAIAQVRQDPQLAQVALDQLRYRTQYLTGRSSDLPTIYADWSESLPATGGGGVAWYLLGTVKTLALLKESFGEELVGTNETQQAFVAATQMVASHRNEQALWYSYLDEPATEVDASASGGIAAALVWGGAAGFVTQPSSAIGKSDPIRACISI